MTGRKPVKVVEIPALPSLAFGTRTTPRSPSTATPATTTTAAHSPVIRKDAITKYSEQIEPLDNLQENSGLPTIIEIKAQLNHEQANGELGHHVGPQLSNETYANIQKQMQTFMDTNRTDLTILNHIMSLIAEGEVR